MKSQNSRIFNPNNRKKEKDHEISLPQKDLMMQDETMSTQCSFTTLPTRPKSNYVNKFSKTKLLTNLYKVDFNKNLIIGIYSVKISPDIKQDSTKKLNHLINSAKKQLKPYIGSNFVINGRTVYSCGDSKSQQKDSFAINVRNGSQMYQLSFKFVRKVEMDKIFTNNNKQSLLPMNFMNNLIKKFFSQMNYVEVGKSGKYINPNSRYTLPNSGIILFNGYQASIAMLQDGPYLRVDGITRIVQDKSVLELINSIYAMNSHLNKQQKRMQVKQQLIGKTVVANYGNSRHWKVLDVIFDVDFDHTNIAEETNMTYTEYYQKNYGMIIKNKKQPLLKAMANGSRKKGQALLIPELLLVSGLPDNFDERKRRQISEKTIITPEEKLQRIQSLISSFNADNQNFSPNALSQSLGVRISQQTQEVEAYSLSPPMLQLGNNASIEKNKVASFTLFNKPLYQHDVPLKILAFIPDDYDFSGISSLVGSTCRNFGIIQDIITIKIKFNDPKRYMQELEKYIEDRNGKYQDRNFIWFILPGNQKSMYSHVKKLCLNTKKPKLSQVSLTSTLAKKGFTSIITKILIQIASKVGNIPWSPKISKNFAKDFIMIGVDICKDLKNKKQSVVSFCSSLSQDGAHYHSNYLYQPSGSKYNEKFKEIIAQCLAAYSQFNHCLPSQIILFKTGCSDSEKDTLIQKQIAEIREVLDGIKDTKIQLTYISVDLAAKQKFFLENKHIINPLYGTLVNSKVVGRNYDFYLISQHCNRGTVKPVHYQVLFTNSAMEEGVLQQFIYTQCFNYMNWSGSVRVPGVLQYAKKLSKLASEYLNCPMQAEQLKDNLFFI